MARVLGLMAALVVTPFLTNLMPQGFIPLFFVSVWVWGRTITEDVYEPDEIKRGLAELENFLNQKGEA